MMRTVQALRRDHRGTTAIEFGLIAPTLFLLLLGCMEFGRMLWTEDALNFAVQEAARCASVTPSTCGSSSQIATYAANQISTNYVPASAFTATTAACGHKVTASFVYPFVFTGLFPNTVTLTAFACLP
jgi:Flp pilus assembly protein TadG